MSSVRFALQARPTVQKPVVALIGRFPAECFARIHDFERFPFARKVAGHSPEAPLCAKIAPDKIEHNRQKERTNTKYVHKNTRNKIVTSND